MPPAFPCPASPPVTPPALLLASSSPYRAALLARLALPFSTRAPHLDETPHPGEAPCDTAVRLARAKAEAVVDPSVPGLVIGSDQVAVLDGQPLGKPGDHARALAQLQAMRGKTVLFHTALCLLDTRPGAKQPVQQDVVTTQVCMRDVADAALDAYLRIETPYDCAGSAKNEGLGIALIEAASSDDPTALTGLPLIALCGMLLRAGVPFFTGGTA